MSRSPMLALLAGAAVRAERELTADVRGSGDVRYHGDPPKVVARSSGSGEVGRS